MSNALIFYLGAFSKKIGS